MFSRHKESSTQPRRVILFSHNSNLSGAPISLAQLARKLPNFGFEPYFIIPHPGPLVGLLKEWNVPYHTLKGSFDVLGFIRYLLWIKPDIVHINSIVRTWPVFVTRIFRKPVVWHVREYLGKKEVYSRLIHLCATRVVLISKEQLNLFCGSKKALYIPNAVDLELFQCARRIEIVPGYNSRVQVVTYIGSIEPRKGLMVLAKAAVLLRERAWIHYAIVGDASEKNEPYKRAVVDVIESEGLRNRFHFLGYRTDIPDILASTDILCHPVFIEVFGRVILEAMALKVPVVATRTGEISMLVEDGKTGLLFYPGDEAALANAIAFLSERKKLRKEMGEKGFQKASREYGIELHAHRVVELYKSMLSHL